MQLKLVRNINSSRGISDGSAGAKISEKPTSGERAPKHNNQFKFSLNHLDDMEINPGSKFRHSQTFGSNPNMRKRESVTSTLHAINEVEVPIRKKIGFTHNELPNHNERLKVVKELENIDKSSDERLNPSTRKHKNSTFDSFLRNQDKRGSKIRGSEDSRQNTQKLTFKQIVSFSEEEFEVR